MNQDQSSSSEILFFGMCLKAGREEVYSIEDQEGQTEICHLANCALVSESTSRKPIYVRMKNPDVDSEFGIGALVPGQVYSFQTDLLIAPDTRFSHSGGPHDEVHLTGYRTVNSESILMGGDLDDSDDEMAEEGEEDEEAEGCIVDDSTVAMESEGDSEDEEEGSGDDPIVDDNRAAMKSMGDSEDEEEGSDEEEEAEENASEEEEEEKNAEGKVKGKESEGDSEDDEEESDEEEEEEEEEEDASEEEEEKKVEGKVKGKESDARRSQGLALSPTSDHSDALVESRCEYDHQMGIYSQTLDHSVLSEPIRTTRPHYVPPLDDRPYPSDDADLHALTPEDMELIDVPQEWHSERVQVVREVRKGKIISMRHVEGGAGPVDDEGPFSRVIIEREPATQWNRWSRNALMVLNSERKKVGYIPKEHAAAFAPEMDGKNLRMYGVVRAETIPLQHRPALGNIKNKDAPYTIYIDLTMFWVRSETNLLALVLGTVLSLILLATAQSCSMSLNMYPKVSM